MRPPTLRTALRSQNLTITTTTTRSFSTTPLTLSKNRIYPSRIRNDSELQTLILMSSSSRTPLLTLWMTTWSDSSSQISSLLQHLLKDKHIGESQGGVSFVEIEMDSPDLGGISGVAMRYGINEIPTLMAFDRSEAQIETKVTRKGDLRDEEFLRGWIEREAERQGRGGGGGRVGGLFGGLFGGR